LLVPRSVEEDDVMLAALDAGAEDIVDDGDTWRVVTPPTQLHAVRSALEEAGIPVESSDLTMVPQATVPLEDAEAARRVLRLIDALDDLDDVQAVHANFDIPDAILETVEQGRSGGDDDGPGRRAGARLHPPRHRGHAGEPPRPHAVRVPGAAGGPRLLPGRQHARVHPPAHDLHGGGRRLPRGRRPGACHLAASD